MDYEQFYRYLDTRSPSEIGECLQNVTRVARKHSALIHEESSHETKSAHNRLYISQQVWFQQAVWSKFGPRSEETIPLRELERETLSLCTTERVGQFIVSVNKIVDEKVQQIQSDAVTPIVKQSPVDAFVDAKKAPDKVAPHTPSRLAQQPSKSPVTSTPHRSTPIVATHRSRFIVLSSDEDAPTSARNHGRAVATTTEVDSGSEHTATTPFTPFTQSDLHPYKRQKTSTPFWTPEKDAALLAAVSEHKEEGWAAVAAHTGFEASAKQCEQRWHSTLEPLQQGLREEAVWTDQELSHLAELVPKHTVEPHWSEYTKGMTQQYVDWKAIGKELGRIPKKCCNKWKVIEKAQLEHPPFSHHDDKLILRREKEWGDRGVGLWAALEKEMRRPGRDIRKRWKDLYEMTS